MDEVYGPEEKVRVGFVGHQLERLKSQNSIVIADKIWRMIHCTKLANITNLYIGKLPQLKISCEKREFPSLFIIVVKL